MGNCQAACNCQKEDGQLDTGVENMDDYYKMPNNTTTYN